MFKVLITTYTDSYQGNGGSHNALRSLVVEFDTMRAALAACDQVDLQTNQTVFMLAVPLFKTTMES